MGADADPADRAVCQRNLVFVLGQILRLLHPIMPFVTEQVYGEMPKEDDAAPMLIVAAWPDAGELAAYVDEDAERAIAMVCEVVGAVRSTRARYGISPKTALPVAVKVAAVHNVAAIASGMARAGADIIVLDGFRGGTGAAPKRIRDNVGIPIELALAAVDERLRQEGIRSTVSLVASGTLRNAADVVRAVALGADAVSIGSAALIAMGCHQCGDCASGRCNWGIATQRADLVARLNPEAAAERVVNLVSGWNREIQEMMGGMGINAIDALRGNRLMLRGVGLNEKELEILGVKYAGE